MRGPHGFPPRIDDLKLAANYVNALTAEVPKRVQEQGEQAVALYQRAILQGLSASQLQNYLASDAFQSQLANRELYVDLVARKASAELVAFALYMAAQGERVYYDPQSKSFRIDGDCSTAGSSGFSSPCGMDLGALAKEAKNNPVAYADTVRNIVLSALAEAGKLYIPELTETPGMMQLPGFLRKMEEAYACAVAWTMLTGNSDMLRDLSARTAGMNLAGTGLNYYTALTKEVLADATANPGRPIDDRRLAIIADKLNDAAVTAGHYERVAEHVYDGPAGLVLASVIATPAKLAANALRAKASTNAVEITIAESLEGATARTLASVESEITAAANNLGQPFLDQGKSVVYVAYKDGKVIYVGITDDLERRAVEQLAEKNIFIQPFETNLATLDSLSRADARAVEQALIERYGLEKNGGDLINRINSISVANPKYSDALARAQDILRAIGF